MNEKLFELKGISKKFGNVTVLKDINWTIYKGEIVGLLGLNGQGKSTLVKILLSLLTEDKGEVIRNIDIKKEAGVMLQEIAVPEKVKVKEWLSLVNAFSDSKTDITKIMAQVGILNEKNLYCENLSGGKQRRLQYAISIVGDPLLLILDEPTVGMDIVSKGKFWMDLNEIVTNKKISVLLISHDLQEVEAFANRISILHNGELVVDEEKDNFLAVEKTRYKISKQKLPKQVELELREYILEEKNDMIYFLSSEIDQVINRLVTHDISATLLISEKITLESRFKEAVNLV